jgi:hypothetical protein
MLTNGFIYKTKTFLIYDSVQVPLFDIRHVINNMALKESDHKGKYTKFKEHICYTGLFENEYGGYVVREFVNEKSMYKIIMSSNCTFSKSFKDDVCDILVELRKHDMLLMQDNKMVLNNDVKPIHNIYNSKHHKYSYQDSDDIVKLIELVAINKITIMKYHKQHVIYIFIIPIYNEERLVIIKIGYSYDIVKRIKDLQDEYKCKQIYLIGIKIIPGERYEDEFHTAMQIRYPELHYNYNIKTKRKTELYYLSDILIEEFNQIREVKSHQTEDILDEEQLNNNEVQDHINNMTKLFTQTILTIEKSNSHIDNAERLLTHITKDDNKTQIVSIVVTKNMDIEIIKQQTELKKQEHEIIKSQIEAKKQDIEMKKEDRATINSHNELIKNQIELRKHDIILHKLKQDD